MTAMVSCEYIRCTDCIVIGKFIAAIIARSSVYLEFLPVKICGYVKILQWLTYIPPHPYINNYFLTYGRRKPF